MKHDPRCETIPLSRLLAEAESDGDTVPESVRLAAQRGVAFERCHADCPVLQRTIARGQELAREHGW